VGGERREIGPDACEFEVRRNGGENSRIEVRVRDEVTRNKALVCVRDGANLERGFPQEQKGFARGGDEARRKGGEAEGGIWEDGGEKVLGEGGVCGGEHVGTSRVGEGRGRAQCVLEGGRGWR
jgi:hypothetical protein